MNLFSTLLDRTITKNGSGKSAIPPIPLNRIRLKAIYPGFIATVVLSSLIGLLPYSSLAATPESDPHSRMIRQGNFSDAVQLLQGKTTEQLKKNEPSAIQSLIQLADAQNGLGEYQAAATTLENALKLAKNHGDSQVTASVLGALGSVYIALDDLDAAENFLKLGSDVNDAGKAPMISSRIYNDFSQVS